MDMTHTEKLAEKLYNEVIALSKKNDIAVTNRLISFDFTRIFKTAELDYPFDCILAEKIFLKRHCKEIEIDAEEYSESGKKISNKIKKATLEMETLSDQDKMIKISEIQSLINKLENSKRVEVKKKVLGIDLFQEGYPIVVLEINNSTKAIYRSFCSQIVAFAFIYYSTMRMIETRHLDFDIVVVTATDSIDIILKLKE